MRATIALLLFLLSGLPAASQVPALHSLTQLRHEVTRRESSSDPDWRNGNRDARPIEPGETLVLADLKGPGEITHIWCTVAASEPQYSRLLVCACTGMARSILRWSVRWATSSGWGMAGTCLTTLCPCE